MVKPNKEECKQEEESFPTFSSIPMHAPQVAQIERTQSPPFNASCDEAIPSIEKSPDIDRSSEERMLMKDAEAHGKQTLELDPVFL